jgi:hypothetical protein
MTRVRFGHDLGSDDLGPRTRKREPFVRRTPVSSSEGLLTLALLFPWLPWVLAGDPGLALPLVGIIAVAAALGLVLRRCPPPVPSISALPAGVVWIAAVLLLPATPWGLICAVGAGIVLLLFATLPSPGELPVPFAMVGVQVGVPVTGGGLSLVVAATLLGVSAPLYVLVLLPTLGALAILVYYFVDTGS